MSLRPGTTLGHDEIRALLGIGRLGEVYRARHRRLGRDVAMKVLREAKTLASLNHPHIAQGSRLRR